MKSKAPGEGYSILLPRGARTSKPTSEASEMSKTKTVSKTAPFLSIDEFGEPDRDEIAKQPSTKAQMQQAE